MRKECAENEIRLVSRGQIRTTLQALIRIVTLVPGDGSAFIIYSTRGGVRYCR